MTELEDQLRRTLGAVATEGGVSPYPHLAARRTRRWTLPARPTLAVLGVAGAILLAVLVVVLPGGHARTPTLSPTQSVQGTWSTLPTSPLAPRSGASQTWTGEQLIVWGGASTGPAHGLFADGASYDPTTGAWTLLPGAPLSARVGQSSVWTGTQLIIWGGYDKADGTDLHVVADGAAYTPATGTWTTLPTGPLEARSSALVTWTGTEVVVLGGNPAVVGDGHRPWSDGATYDPNTREWASIKMPYVMPTRPLDWVVSVQGDGGLYAWTQFSDKDASGQDLFRWDESARRWELIPRNDGLGNVLEAVWTGKSLLTRGFPRYCPGCDGPAQPELSALSDPTTRIWTTLSADPIGGSHDSSAWVRGHLISFNAMGQYGVNGPGTTTAFDPATKTWETLPSAPSGCGEDQLTLMFAQDEALLFCGDTGGGLAYVLEPTRR